MCRILYLLSSISVYIVRGDIKLFDLGLVKELQPLDEDNDGNYKLSMAGTPRYMAPECGMYRPYNFSADVYSFCMLLWEIITLEKPLNGLSYKQLKQQVFEKAWRPSMKKVWPASMRSLIASGWNQNPKVRPSMNEVYDQLKTAYTILQPGKVIMEDLSHNRRRSTFVVNRVSQLSVRHLLNGGN